MHYLVYDLRHTSAPLLTPAELDSREQAAYARRGERYLLERSLLKYELQRLSGIPAGEIRLSYSDLGKPEFAACHFNLSHSGDILCLGFHHAPIGVDVEQVRPRVRMDAIAAHFMCPEQYAAWRGRGSSLREFYACWCAAEAIIKQRGAAVWQAQRYPFLYRPEQGGSIEPCFAGAPAIELFEPAEGYTGAVASAEV